MMLLGCLVGLAGAAAAAPAGASGERAGKESAAHARLQATIQKAIHGAGPLLNADERALVERKCGYAPGSWDGQNFSMNNGVLHCSNGKRVDDPEVRAMMAAAGPRIEKRVRAAMARPEVTQAIDAVAREASAEAMRELARKWND